jgi:hypothetical protein
MTSQSYVFSISIFFLSYESKEPSLFKKFPIILNCDGIFLRHIFARNWLKQMCPRCSVRLSALLGPSLYPMALVHLGWSIEDNLNMHFTMAIPI